MYHYFVKKIIHRNFEALNRGDYESVLKTVSKKITHTFAGNHAIGGTRHSVESMRLWFKRLYIITPHIHFTIKNIAISGNPWNTTIAIEWEDKARPANGEPYLNEGVHIIKMRWGKAFYIHGYFDTQVFIDLCERLASIGISEAIEMPIVD
ncbi:MAG: nuclear transport factor 2 family protein [Saprospiraceae bacterium]|nr:nuclear transport factor 2 family protein [Saprospiraceae bacterium]